MLKACKKCGDEKPLEAFPKCKEARDGRAGSCTSCKTGADRARGLTPRQKQLMAERSRRWKAANADKWAAQKLVQNERRRRRDGCRRMADIAAEAAARDTERRSICDARRAEQRAKPWNAPALTDAERWRIRYRTDTEYQISERVRAQLRKERRGERYMKLARAALRSEGKSPTFERVVGYSISALRAHIERQFTRRMNWVAFCKGRIHIDHILPISSFDVGTVDGFRAAWALTNLRPSWARDNIAKASRRTHLI